MSRRPHHPFRDLLILVLGLWASHALVSAAEHPSLVSSESAQCAVCHEDLLENRAFLHAPVEDDCTLCHDVTVSDEGTTVTMMEAEPDLCLMCHAEMEGAVEGTLAAPHPAVMDSCLSCHGPHATDNEHLLVEPGALTCALCHDLEELNEGHGDQLTAGTDCARCHPPHGSANPGMLAGSRLHRPFADGSCEGCHRRPFGKRIRLRTRGARLCTACHADLLEVKPDETLHAALEDRRGRSGCLSCHDPHMSAARGLLVAPGPELCEGCHGEIVDLSLAEGGHAPAADDCGECHLPHKSSEPALLGLPREGICANCHDVEDEELVGSHLGAPLGSSDCLSCHTPHGSGREDLLAVNVHEPVLEGCEPCHEGGHDELAEGGESSLCLMCHSEIGEEAEKAPVPHEALEIARCADCHNPHASSQEHLVKLPAGGECLECHDEQGAGPGEVAHGVIDLLGCRACHEPHGGSEAKLLRKTGSELCLACHAAAVAPRRREEGQVTLLDRFTVEAGTARAMASLRLSPDGTRDHPVTGHRVLGAPTPEELQGIETTYQGELTCMTCHDPHKGASRLLLRWGAASAMESCLECHPK